MDNDERGYYLELLLTKLRYKCLPWEQAQPGSQSGSQVALQIIGMSATMPNAAQVASWLDAELLEDDFRPVPVYKYLKVRAA